VQLLDSVCWEPVSTKLDYDLATQKIVQSVFLEEFTLINELDLKLS
jgi:hypothetical protein